MSNLEDTQKVLISMGFAADYINKAFVVYKRNYGTTYLFNVELITEIAARLQSKDISRTGTHSTANSTSTDKSNVSLTESITTCIEIKAGEDIPLKQEQEDRAEHILNIDPNETNEMNKDRTSDKPTKYRLCSLILMLLIWMILIIYILTYFIVAMRCLQWLIYLTAAVYIIYLIECFYVAQTPFYLRNIKATNEVKQYVNKLIEAKPFISWEIEHFHTDSKENNVTTSTEQRVINYAVWSDESEYFDLNEFDECMFMKLKIIMNQTEPGFMDGISSEYYKNAYDETLKLTQRQDAKLRIKQNIDLVAVFPQDMVIDGVHVGTCTNVYEDRFLVRNKKMQRNVCTLHWFWYYVFSLLTLSYFYRRYVDKMCVCKQIILKKAIKLDEKFPYCFDTACT